MKITQITHNDLDGYGASTVVGAYVAVARVIHVARYRDVAAIFGAEINRLRACDEPEMLIVSDIGLEKPSVAMIKAFAAMNAERPGHAHRLIVMDHHSSSIDWLTAMGFHALPERDINHHQACYFTVPAQDLTDPAHPERDAIVVLIDTTRSATKIAHDHAELYAGERCRLRIRNDEILGGGAFPNEALAILVDGVDAVDLWIRDRDIFDVGAAINDGFWEVVGTFIPEGHELHDRFVGLMLLGMAGLARNGEAFQVELGSMNLRYEAINRLIAESGIAETPAQRMMSTRMRISRLIAHSEALFTDLPGDVPTKMSFALDSGIFQRVSDEMLREGRAALVINVFRGGQMSLRSRNGEAVALAKKLGGGGHPNAAGAGLNVSGVFSLKEAQATFIARISDAQIKD